MKSIALLFFLIGIIFIVIGYTKSTEKCPPTKIQYRFVPRSFYEEQLEPDNIESSFNSMFNSNPLEKYNLNTQSTNYNNFFNISEKN